MRPCALLPGERMQACCWLHCPAQLSSLTALLPALPCHKHAAPPCSYSPHITEIKVLERRPVRRAKLYYLRERTAKEYRT